MKREYIRNGCIGMGIAAIAVSPSLDDAITQKDIDRELNKPQIPYEERIEMPEHLREEAIADIARSIKDVTKAHFKAKENHDKAEEITKISNSPPYLQSGSPPTEQEMLDNIREIQNTYISTNNQFTAAQQHHSHAKREIQSINHRANEMETRIKDIQSKEGRPDKQKQAADYFKRTYSIEPDKAAEVIKELREQAAAKERELKPTEKKVEGLSKERDKILQNYEEQISRISAHKDGQAVLARFELSRKAENVDQRDITKLKQIERSAFEKEHEKESPCRVY